MRKYFIDGKEVDEDEFDRELYDAVECDCEDEYFDVLNDCYESVEIAGITFDPADILKQLDPIAYRCGLRDYLDSRFTDIKYDLESGDTATYNATDFEIVEKDDEEDE